MCRKLIKNRNETNIIYSYGNTVESNPGALIKHKPFESPRERYEVITTYCGIIFQS